MRDARTLSCRLTVNHLSHYLLYVKQNLHPSVCIRDTESMMSFLQVALKSWLGLLVSPLCLKHGLIEGEGTEGPHVVLSTVG